MVLLIIGVLSLLGFFGGSQSPITGGVNQVLGWVAGFGAVLFPLLLIFLGLWFVVRNEQRFPMLSAERMLGVVLLYLNILSWLHWFDGGGWPLAKAGQGGGYVGAFFERLLVVALGEVGAAVVLVAWLLLALAFTFDLSIPDLFRKMTKPAVKTGEFIAEKSTKIVEPLQQGEGDPEMPAPTRSRRIFRNGDTPPHGFTPLNGKPPRKSAGKKEEKAADATPASSAKSEVSGSQMARVFQSSESSLDWKLPNVDEILNPAIKAVVRQNVDQDRARVIEETLESFGAPGHVVEIHRGPTFTQFGVEPDFIQTRNGQMRVRVNKITSLADDLALALAAQRIRVQAPVPGRHYIGIEVPNEETELVSLREGVQSKSFQKLNAFLRFVLGKDVAGKPVAVDLSTMPHLLIAGTTGSGKSVCINAILSCLLLDRTPNELRLVLVDPKRVELTGYNGIPHLLTPVIVEMEKVVGTLQWMSREMDSRYKKFAEVGARNISDYNNSQPQKLPYIVVVIDELADLMMMAPEETERNLNRLAQLARATGIHVIIATQRPSVDVITGMIKANFPSRISFTVVSGVDSRVVLDQPGAERLMGRGDMLFQAPDAPAPKRLQGVFVSNDEIQRLVQYWIDQKAALMTTDPQAGEKMPQKVFPNATLTQTPLFDKAPEPDEDPYLSKAIDIVREEERASISMLQRKLSIGYTRAARIVDRLEEKGIIGEADSGSGVRPVLDFGDEEMEQEE
ncbi:MAG: segregation ATPase FtsK/SpoIIIE, family [Chloroflexota bacterium]|nr:segregation ATPase FtsK/SpoIIIE, family [Chloroflexota bacterium]